MGRLISWFSQHWNARVTSSKEASLARDVEQLTRMLEEERDQRRATQTELQIERDRVEALTEQVRFVETCREAELRAVHAMIEVHGAVAGRRE